MTRVLLLLSLFCTSVAFSQGYLQDSVVMSYYFPFHNGERIESVPLPADVLGYQIGQMHVEHGQQTRYLHEVARASDRVTIEEYARSWEYRPLHLLFITSPANHSRLEEIRTRHIALANGAEATAADASLPAIVWLGYSVHGNESSGGNAACLMAWHLASSQSTEVQNWLDSTIVIIDPCLNPDGFNRFATWVNNNRGRVPVADPRTREHNEPWPGGRTNHYWFDLNRDWLPAVHPESRGRLEQFYRWRPHVLTDHHEMGTNSTFFFQPGVPSRNNPLTPEETYQLTGDLAHYHAHELDRLGETYYTGERFDDFYYGKGSTYPDVNGSIGILFEQASSRGHEQESQYGTLTFPKTIRNQVATSLSTIRGTHALRDKFKQHQREMAVDSERAQRNSGIAGWVIDASQDPAKAQMLLSMLRNHSVETYLGADNLTINGNSYAKGASIVVPANQPRFLLLQSMFERRTTFTDSLFYDVSSWNFASSSGLQIDELRSSATVRSMQGKEIERIDAVLPYLRTNDQTVACYIPWNFYNSPAVLSTLLAEGVRVRSASRPFTIQTTDSTATFRAGTLIVVLGNQERSREDITEVLRATSRHYSVPVFASETGYAEEGSSLGSGNMWTMNLPSVAILTGNGVSSYSAGSLWHMFDIRMNMQPVMLDSRSIWSSTLEDFDVLILPDMWYSADSATMARIAEWTKQGGTLLTLGNSIRHVSDNRDFGVRIGLSASEDTPEARPYYLIENDRGAKRIGGVILEATMDLTNPLCFGYDESDIHLFRTNSLRLRTPRNAYAAPLRYTKDVLASGFLHTSHKENLSETPACVTYRAGGGIVIAFPDALNFRSFWWNTNKLLMNAVYFGGNISGSAKER